MVRCIHGGLLGPPRTNQLWAAADRCLPQERKVCRSAGGAAGPGGVGNVPRRIRVPGGHSASTQGIIGAALNTSVNVCQMLPQKQKK